VGDERGDEASDLSPLSFAPDGRNFVGEICSGDWTTDYKSFASRFSMSNKDFTLYFQRL
jgi:hypothetical protein